MNDADFLNERLIALGKASSKAKKAGKCTHGWLQNGPVVACLDCGQTFPGMKFEDVALLHFELLEEFS